MPDLLTIERLSAGYGEAVVLNEISLTLAEGQSLALLGRNGMGKTTLINSIVGVTRFMGGTIALDGRDITPLRPDQRAHAGIGWVPQERNIFKSLTVEENLTAVARPGRWTQARIYELFPRLHERRRNLGNQLSGGEQQMLAVGRALILNPRVMLLDEPLEGLAPILVEELLRALRRIIRDEGMSAILVEQNAQKVLGVTDRAAILERGAVVSASPPSDPAAAARPGIEPGGPVLLLVRVSRMWCSPEHLRSTAPLIRQLPRNGIRRGPGSAAHHSASLHAAPRPGHTGKVTAREAVRSRDGTGPTPRGASSPSFCG
jgi:branched-chain amino acid transport system ATP-binding protein